MKLVFVLMIVVLALPARAADAPPPPRGGEEISQFKDAYADALTEQRNNAQNHDASMLANVVLLSHKLEVAKKENADLLAVNQALNAAVEQLKRAPRRVRPGMK